MTATAAMTPTAKRTHRGTRENASRSRSTAGKLRAASKDGPDGLRDCATVVHDLPPGEANHVEPEELEVSVAPAVLLERGADAVRVPPVEFDDQPPVAPEEVDDESVDARIHFGLWKTVAAKEAEKAALELAPGVVALDPVADRQPQELGLAESRGEHLSGEGAAEVRERAGGCGDGDAIPPGAVRRGQCAGPVDADPTMVAARPGDGHVRFAAPL